MTSIKNSIINKISKNQMQIQTQSQDSKEVKVEDQPTVDFLVFVVHGVGEAKKHSKKVKQFEEYAREYIRYEYGDQYSVHFIPIRWHDEFHDLATVDKRLNAILLDTCSAIRSLSNNFMGDALFYFTSYHGQRIISAVVKLMNKSYSEYLSTHPDFKGKVICLGHSLGGVILYDIIANQDFKEIEKFRAYNKPDVKENSEQSNPSNTFNITNPFIGNEEIYNMNDFSNMSNISNTTNTNTTTATTNMSSFSDNDSFDSVNLMDNIPRDDKKLLFGFTREDFPTINFYPEFLYICGSSISAAMIMRCQYYQNYHLPEHMIFQNIYHRSDPFAFRFEPMVDPEFKNVKPVPIKNITITTNYSPNNTNNNNNISNNNNNNNNSNNNDDIVSPTSARSVTSSTSIFGNLRERLTIKLNGQGQRSGSRSNSQSPTKELAPSIKQNQTTNAKDQNQNQNQDQDQTKIPVIKESNNENNDKNSDNDISNKKDKNSEKINNDNILLSPQSGVNGDIDTDLSFSPTLSSDSSSDVPSKIISLDEIKNDKVKLTESSSLSKSESVQPEEKDDKIKQYKGDISLPSKASNETKNSLDSSIDNKNEKENSMITSMISNDNQIQSQTQSQNDTIDSKRKSSRKSSDGILNRVSRLFSQGSGNSNSNKDRSIHSSSSTSLSSLNSSSSSPSLVQEPVTFINENSSIVQSGSSETHSKVKKSKTHKKKKRLGSFISYGSNNDSRKKSIPTTSIICSNEALPDGQVPIENHPLLKYRVDYMLPENITDVIRGTYVTALGAHTSYWQNRTMIYHIMKSIITKSEYDKAQQPVETIPSPLI